MSREHREEGEEELHFTDLSQSNQWHVKRDVLVERQVYAVTVSPIVVPSVNLSFREERNGYKHQLDEVVELANDVVRAVYRRVSFVSLDSDAH